MAEPTSFPALNELLRELVSSAEAILGENFGGAYLQGSFAVGDADEYSDVDFIMVTHGELGDEQVAALQAMHARLYALDVPWAQHLEGSYVPKDALRRVDLSRAPFLYLDNGASELIRDNHCNTAVVRWSLREHGLTLAGPEPKTLVEPVTADQLRAEVRANLDEWADWAKTPPTSRWKQPYLVISFCRRLHTLSFGTVASKREAGEWARDALADEWRPLIQRALDDRPDPWERVHQPADPELVAQTIAFVDYAVRLLR
jgi:predicted nucleotidyltransferase